MALMRTQNATLAVAPLRTAGLAAGLLWSLLASGAHAQAAFDTADEPRDTIALRARLDPATHRIEGALVWRFTNRSRVSVSELYWHLYPNAFRRAEHGGSVFVREGGGDIRHRRVGVEGRLGLGSLTDAQGRDLLARSTTEVGVPDDTTQLRTSLYGPLAPGASMELRATFTTVLPEAVARSGYFGDFNVAAQWFPKLARLEADGRWASFPYHGMGEFYADFADYELEVSVPAGVGVVAGGDPGPVQTLADGTQVHHFTARAVHDMVFVASPTLRIIDEEHRIGEHAVRVRVAYPPGYEGTAREQLALTRSGLSYLSEVYGDYPYATLTVVVPPDAASAVSGMEYPTLFVSSGPWWGSAQPLWGAMTAETCIHELAHQWFQGLVATNEVRYPVLDEGLTSWAAMDFFQRQAGHASGGRLGSVSLDVFELERSWSLASVTPRSPLSAAYDFDSLSYFRTVYVYVPLALESIARTWGRARLLRALGSYARLGRFAHPGPDALRSAFEAEYGAWFVRDVFDAVFQRGCTLRTELSEPERRCDETGCREQLVVRRRGCLPLPLEVRVDSASGTQRYPFPASERELRLTVDPARVWRVQVDPTRRNLTDPRRLDDVRVFPANTRGAPGAPAAPARAGLSTWLLGLFQLLYGLVGP